MKFNKNIIPTHKLSIKPFHQQESRKVREREVEVKQEEVHAVKQSVSMDSTSSNKTRISPTEDFDEEMQDLKVSIPFEDSDLVKRTFKGIQ